MISGYFGIKRVRDSVIKIASKVWFYAVTSGELFGISVLCGYHYLGMSWALEISCLLGMLLLTFSSNFWWFATSYLFLVILSPLLQKWTSLLSKKGFAIVLFFIWGYGVASFLNVTYYSLVWRPFFYYLLGSFVGRHLDVNQLKQKRYVSLQTGIFFWVAYTVLEMVVATYEGAASAGMKRDILMRLFSLAKVELMVPFSVLAVFLFSFVQIWDTRSGSIPLQLRHSEYIYFMIRHLPVNGFGMGFSVWENNICLNIFRFMRQEQSCAYSF